MKKIQCSWLRLGISFFAIIIGGVAATWGQPLLNGNPEAKGVIVNTFSVLAGFLIAIMTLLGEPRMQTDRTWRADQLRRDTIFPKLVRKAWLFVLYLIIILLIFIASLITKKLPQDHSVIYWLEWICLFLSVFAFFWSLLLPHYLLRLQMSRYDELINKKKEGRPS